MKCNKGSLRSIVKKIKKNQENNFQKLWGPAGFHPESPDFRMLRTAIRR
jgi:hypothetical protein